MARSMVIVEKEEKYYQECEETKDRFAIILLTGGLASWLKKIMRPEASTQYEQHV